MPRTIKNRKSKIGTSGGGYWHRSQQPLQSLFFLLPLVVFYEIGTLIYATDYRLGVTRYIYARSMLRDFFEGLGVTGYYLPGLIVIVVLLTWHLFRRDPWDYEPRLYVMMGAESIALALPLFVFMLVLARQPQVQMALHATPLTLAASSPGSAALPAADMAGWQARLVFSIGAGIYEELLFRLIGIALVHMVLVDLLALPHSVGATGAVILSAIAFAAYHFSAENPFTMVKCALYTGAGIYFAVVYVFRGFGIVAGTHAVYDIFVLALTVTHH